MSGLTVYDLLLDDDCELCHPVNHDDFSTITDLVNGMPRKASWTPIDMELIREDEGKKFLPSDTPWYGDNALIFKPAVVLAIGYFLQEYGELLPLRCKDAKLMMYNATRVIDALDMKRSSYSAFDDGTVMLMDRGGYVFHPEVVRDVDIFRSTGFRVSSIFVGQRFVDLWTAHHLKGLEFVPIWRST